MKLSVLTSVVLGFVVFGIVFTGTWHLTTPFQLSSAVALLSPASSLETKEVEQTHRSTTYDAEPWPDVEPHFWPALVIALSRFFAAVCTIILVGLLGGKIFLKLLSS